MLYLYFKPEGEECFNKSFFNMYLDRKWFDDPLVREMIKDIDKSEVIAGTNIESSVLGPISPRELSSGVKGLILMQCSNESWHYRTSLFGDNCYKWIPIIAKNKDIHLNVHHRAWFRDFDEHPDLDVKVKVNGKFEDKIYHWDMELIDKVYFTPKEW